MKLGFGFEGALVPRAKVIGRSALLRQREVGARIAGLRRDRGVSQSDLGAKIGVSQRVMSYYEKGSTRIPADALLKIADVLKVSAYELMGRAPAASRAPKDKKLWKVLETLEALPPRDRKFILRTIETVARTAGA